MKNPNSKIRSESQSQSMEAVVEERRVAKRSFKMQPSPRFMCLLDLGDNLDNLSAHHHPNTDYTILAEKKNQIHQIQIQMEQK